MASDVKSTTVRPSLEEFRRLAADHRVVPVWQEFSADLLTPVAAFLRLCPDETPGFLLESVEHDEQWSRWSFVGCRPRSTVTVSGLDATVSGEKLPADIRKDQGALALVEDLLAHYRSPTLEDLPPLHGGLVGYLGYDVIREVEDLPNPPHDESRLPEAVLSVIGDLVAFDHFRQRVTLISNAVMAEGLDDEQVTKEFSRRVGRLRQLVRDLQVPLAEPLIGAPTADEPLPEVVSSMSPTQYGAAVAAAKEHISAGDAFQVVLSQRFSFDLEAAPIDVYRSLRQSNPSPYMYFVRQPELTLVGSSPEPMVQVLGGRVISRPVAGTRRRGHGEAEDRRLGAELVEDPKERAEHVMLVDLARNDVGRVVDFGTEKVDEFMTLERYSHVMHLTSQVSGQLAEGAGPVDVLRATLPAGTVSGAPKVRAMEIIDDLEPVKRGPYAGVVGYVDFSGNVDTAIAIRTMVVEPDGRAWVQAGAGVVADSDPAAEDAECHAKARALLAAVPNARRMTERRLGRGSGASRSASRRAALRMRSSFAVCPIRRETLLLVGEDAISYLHGQLTQDVAGLDIGTSAWSFLLEPDGKVVALLRVVPLSQKVVGLDMDLGQVDAVRARLERFMIRVDCQFGEGPVSSESIAVRGPKSDDFELVGSPGTSRASPPPGVGGYDLFWLFTDRSAVPADAAQASPGALEALRIEAGWPTSGVDIGPGDVPAEAGPHVVAAAVDFTKGCYTGQELVERMASREAIPPRPLRLLSMDKGAAVPPPGSEVCLSDEVVGVVTSSSFSPWREAPVALARLPRRVRPPAIVRVQWPHGEAVARVVTPPLE